MCGGTITLQYYLSYCYYYIWHLLHIYFYSIYPVLLFCSDDCLDISARGINKLLLGPAHWAPVILLATLSGSGLAHLAARAAHLFRQPRLRLPASVRRLQGSEAQRGHGQRCENSPFSLLLVSGEWAGAELLFTCESHVRFLLYNNVCENKLWPNSCLPGFYWTFFRAAEDVLRVWLSIFTQMGSSCLTSHTVWGRGVCLCVWEGGGVKYMSSITKHYFFL